MKGYFAIKLGENNYYPVITEDEDCVKMFSLERTSLQVDKLKVSVYFDKTLDFNSPLFLGSLSIKDIPENENFIEVYCERDNDFFYILARVADKTYKSQFDLELLVNYKALTIKKTLQKEFSFENKVDDEDFKLEEKKLNLQDNAHIYEDSNNIDIINFESKEWENSADLNVSDFIEEELNFEEDARQDKITTFKEDVFNFDDLEEESEDIENFKKESENLSQIIEKENEEEKELAEIIDEDSLGYPFTSETSDENFEGIRELNYYKIKSFSKKKSNKIRIPLLCVSIFAFISLIFLSSLLIFYSNLKTDPTQTLLKREQFFKR